MIEIGLINPKSPTNVGAVLRAAGCFEANRIIYSGNRYDIAKKFHTDTKSANNSIPLIHVDDFITAKHESSKLVCVDLVEGATCLPEFNHPENALYLFGPEDGSISQELIDLADEVIYIPATNSLNLAAAVNVVLYDRVVKLNSLNQGDELIRQSRDVNNRLVVNK